MKISIIKKPIAGGVKKSLHLQFYDGYSKDKDSKITHRRSFKKLDLFLYTDPKTKAEKTHNQQQLEIAELAKSKALMESATGMLGFDSIHKQKGSFTAFFELQVIDKHKTRTNNTAKAWECAIKQFKKFSKVDDVQFSEITPQFCKEFREYLLSTTTKNGTPLSSGSASHYLNSFKSVVNLAYQKGFLPRNPLVEVSNIRVESKKIEYLTIPELKELAKTECRYPVLKNAFLFSCLTGLRWSDVQKLIWDDVQEFESGYRIIFHQKKTKGLQYLDLNPDAVKLMGNRKAGKVFQGLRDSVLNNVEILRWCMAAGIAKHITFHCARHTCAVSLLTQGVDIYTVSKLLGHSSVKTTEIYADIIDMVRKEAVHKIPSIF